MLCDFGIKILPDKRIWADAIRPYETFVPYHSCKDLIKKVRGDVKRVQNGLCLF